MMRKSAAIIASSVLAVFIGGCSANNDNQNTDVGMNNRDNRNTPNVNQVRNGDYITPRNINTNDAGVRDNNNGKDMRLSEDISKSLNDLKEIKRSTVIVVGDQAYVAAQLTDDKQTRFSNEVKQRIAKRVREADRTVRHIYISTSPNFVKRMDQYARDVRNGKPISGMYEEFSSVVKRVFPRAY